MHPAVLTSVLTFASDAFCSSCSVISVPHTVLNSVQTHLYSMSRLHQCASHQASVLQALAVQASELCEAADAGCQTCSWGWQAACASTC